MELRIILSVGTERPQFKEEELEQISDALQGVVHTQFGLSVKEIDFQSTDTITVIPAPLYACTECGAMVRHVHNPTGRRADTRRLCPECWRKWEHSGEAAEIAAIGSGVRCDERHDDSWQWGDPSKNRKTYEGWYDESGHMKPKFLVHQEALEQGKIDTDEYRKRMLVPVEEP